MSPAYEPDCATCDSTTELRERIAVLETKLADMQPKVSAMYEMMVQGRGVTRLGRATVGLAGAGGAGMLISAKWHAFLVWLGSP